MANKEEKVNTLTHALGIVLALVGTLFFTVRYGNALGGKPLIGLLLFGVTALVQGKIRTNAAANPPTENGKAYPTTQNRAIYRGSRACGRSGKTRSLLNRTPHLPKAK